MDTERKLLYLVAVIAPIVEAMSLFTLREADQQLNRAIAANSHTIACEEHLLRAWMQCPGIRQRHPDRVLGTAPGDG
jgi:hypothetical protein